MIRRKLIFALFQSSEEIRHRIDLDFVKAHQRIDSSDILKMLLAWSSSPIADAVDKERIHVLLVEFAQSFIARAKRFRAGAGIVFPLKREMGEYLAPIDSFPKEGMEREIREAVPGELDGEEIIHAAFFYELREIAVIAKGIGKPEVTHVMGEILEIEFLAIQHLPRKFLFPRDIGVEFHKRPAD